MLRGILDSSVHFYLVIHCCTVPWEKGGLYESGTRWFFVLIRSNRNPVVDSATFVSSASTFSALQGKGAYHFTLR
jgi:hypothetical protein